ncbi:hypothetical protein [Sorangium sp. So ce1182]|uniref:hypothetical protein n=1 Tax=Sorangium sp. So ce1182 TaxID=3133334 RepID=UPI003F60A672
MRSSSSGAHGLARLTRWLGELSPSHVLFFEDGGTRSISPTARWLAGVRVSGAHELISASLGPGAGLWLGRDILVALCGELYPDEVDENQEPELT